jgi:hypothetical protein
MNLNPRAGLFEKSGGKEKNPDAGASGLVKLRDGYY